LRCAVQDPDLAALATWPEEILDRRLICDGHAANVQVLIKWSSLSRDEATWGDYNMLKTHFPDAALWAGDLHQAAASVTPPT
jgi:hypothetical protein